MSRPEMQQVPPAGYAHPQPQVPVSAEQNMINQGMQYQAAMLAACASGNHSWERKYGVIGILCAVICFPCGLIGLCIDNKKKCSRCGAIME